MFQDGQLFPQLTVARNVAYPLRIRRTPRAAAAARVAELLDLVGLSGFADRLPGDPVRRRAAAGRPGPRAGRVPAAAAARRAAQRPRRRAAPAPGRGPAADPGRGRDHRGDGDPRPRGGVRRRRRPRRDAGRPDRPVRARSPTSGGRRPTRRRRSSSATPGCSTGAAAAAAARRRRAAAARPRSPYAAPRWRSPTTARWPARWSTVRTTPGQVRLVCRTDLGEVDAVASARPAGWPRETRVRLRVDAHPAGRRCRAGSSPASAALD